MEVFTTDFHDLPEKKIKDLSIMEDLDVDDGLASINDASISFHAMFGTLSPRTMSV